MNAGAVVGLLLSLAVLTAGCTGAASCTLQEGPANRNVSLLWFEAGLFDRLPEDPPEPLIGSLQDLRRAVIPFVHPDLDAAYGASNYTLTTVERRIDTEAGTTRVSYNQGVVTVFDLREGQKAAAKAAFREFATAVFAVDEEQIEAWSEELSTGGMPFFSVEVGEDVPWKDLGPLFERTRVDWDHRGGWVGHVPYQGDGWSFSFRLPHRYVTEQNQEGTKPWWLKADTAGHAEFQYGHTNNGGPDEEVHRALRDAYATLGLGEPDVGAHMHGHRMACLDEAGLSATGP